jgi:hypothetical protein
MAAKTRHGGGGGGEANTTSSPVDAISSPRPRLQAPPCRISDSIFSSTSLHDACLVISIFSGKNPHDACLFATAGG